MKTKRKPQPRLGGYINVPIRKSQFGEWLDLSDVTPEGANLVMVLVNNGGGLEAGHPQPVGFIRLTHQIYVKDLERILADRNANNPLWISVCFVKSTEYVDVWSREKP